MLPDDIVLKNCFHQASKLRGCGVEFNELVSIGYIVGKTLSNPKLLATWIYYTMLKFATERAKSVAMLSENDYDIDDEYQEKMDSTFLSEDIRAAIKDAKLSHLECDILRMRFYEDKKESDIANFIGISEPSLCIKLQKILQKLKRPLEIRRR